MPADTEQRRILADILEAAVRQCPRCRERCPHNCRHMGSHCGTCMTCGCPTSAIFAPLCTASCENRQSER